MRYINNQPVKSFESYTKEEWKNFLGKAAYRGFKINKISGQIEKKGDCSLENGHRIRSTPNYNCLWGTAQTIDIDLNTILKNQDRWTVSRLIHTIKMLFSDSKYAKKFNARIENLACQLNISALKHNFADRCCDNLGTLAILPEDIRDHIVQSIPTNSDNDYYICINLMKRFQKAPLGEKPVYGTIHPRKFANWINIHRLDVFFFELCDQELLAIFPYLERLSISLLCDPPPPFYRFETCKNLKRLCLDYLSDLCETEFQSIGKLSNLTSLSIYRCPGITDRLIQWISPLNQLKLLEITYCDQITEKGFAVIEKLTSLTWLNIGECAHLNDQALNAIEPLTNLTELNLSMPDNPVSPITEKGIASIGKLKNLKILKLSSFSYGEKGFSYLEGLTNLKYLEVFGHSLSNEDLNSIGKLIRLKYLGMIDIRISGEGFKYLSPLKELQHLDLRRAKNIDSDHFKYLKELPKLTLLNIRHLTHFNPDHIDHIAQITSLKILNATGCSEISDEHLLKLPNSIDWCCYYGRRKNGCTFNLNPHPGNLWGYL